eukprot:3844192-Amphidinium_carterae.1
MPENPHDADFSILRERGDAALGKECTSARTIPQSTTSRALQQSRQLQRPHNTRNEIQRSKNTIMNVGVIIVIGITVTAVIT